MPDPLPDTFRFIAKWDDEAKVWYTSAENYSGFHVDAPTIPELVTTIKEIIALLLEEVNADPSRIVPTELLVGDKKQSFNVHC